ncbi:MAG: helix-turn-helix domain-containing protein [Butyrivibrio sp.]|uniref:helix-turn-helix transcriptional regulator n=1 Tax=Butyrivibrio sp. TaxID=28121 RepID=UPI001B0B27BA|nr:helix-turn-helix domain-containing protein [Butyrivibrio sp.]MBO6242009.1 helix-turn-helix domain-containing protein [Butyrivibrio sp.]
MVQDKWIISNNYKKASIDLLQNNLSALRAKIGISQEELASIIGVTRQTYYPVESGKKTMTWSMFLALIFVFDAINDTSEMLEELRIYPIDLIMKFNDQISPNESII